jgi:hypothetical protein
VRADEEARAGVAARLSLLALDLFDADVSVLPWHDGVVVEAKWRGRIVQTCGLSLEAFATDLEGAFEVRLVPKNSRNAPPETLEVILDPNGEDPPEVLETDAIEIGELLVEHLAVEIDPFPKKPGARFEPPPAETVISPFAVLKRPPA